WYSARLQGGFHFLALVSLQLEDAVLERAAGAARGFQGLGQSREQRFTARQAGHHRHQAVGRAAFEAEADTTLGAWLLLLRRRLGLLGRRRQPSARVDQARVFVASHRRVLSRLRALRATLMTLRERYDGKQGTRDVRQEAERDRSPGACTGEGRKA